MEHGKNRLEIIAQKTENNSYKNWQEVFEDLHYLNTDNEKNDVRLLITLSNLTLEKGLSYNIDKNAYLETTRLLAALYAQTGEFEKVVNKLQLLIDLQNEEVPSWVFHDFIDAEIHTSGLRRILKNPKLFLSDLARTENDEELRTKVTAKQRNILKELFRTASTYISQNPECQLDKESLDKAAELYSVKDSLEYKIFEKTLAGENPEELYNQEDEKNLAELFEQKSKENENLQQENSKIEKEKAELTKQYSELQKAKTELEQRKSALENTNADLETKKSELEALNESLKQKQKSLEVLLNTQKDSFSKEKAQILEKLKNLNLEIDKKDSFISQKNHELNQLRDEVQKLNEKLSQPAQEKLEPYVAVAKFLHPAYKILCVWLKRNLPNLNIIDNWQEYVVQWVKSQDLESVHHIEDIDLSTLLFISMKNKWILSHQTGLERDDFDYFAMMIDVRNRFAHFNFNEDREQNIRDLKIIKQFLVILGSELEIRRKIDLCLQQY